MIEQNLNQGDIRTITADAPPEGYVFDQWTGDTQYLTDPLASETTVTMPNDNVEVTASYSLIPQYQSGYGALYNWYAITDVRNIAPVGFHVPTQEELTILLGTGSSEGYKYKTPDSNWSGNVPTNETGFSAPSSGYRLFLGDFASSTQFFTIACTYDYSLYTIGGEIAANDYMRVPDSVISKKNGISMRFIKDSGTTTSVIGNDGKWYHCVVIGTQCWTAANSNETKYRTGEYIHGFEDGVYTPISNEDWFALETEGMCYYNDDIDNG